MSTSKKSCIFCGRVCKLTKEHVLPHHWKNEFPSAGPVGFVREGFTEPRFAKVNNAQVTPFDFTAKVVCPDCNNGWMSQTDLRIKPSFMKLAKFDSTSFPEKDIDNLKQWAVKTSFVRTYLDEGAWQHSMPEYSRSFYLQRKPTEVAIIQIGLVNAPIFKTTNTSYVGSSFYRLTNSVVRNETLNVVTITTGHFLVQTILHSGREHLKKRAERYAKISNHLTGNNLVRIDCPIVGDVQLSPFDTSIEPLVAEPAVVTGEQPYIPPRPDHRVLGRQDSPGIGPQSAWLGRP